MALPSGLAMSALPILSLLSMGHALPLSKRDDQADDQAGASGDDKTAYDLSTGGLVAIIVVVVVVAIFGSMFDPHHVQVYDSFAPGD